MDNSRNRSLILFKDNRYQQNPIWLEKDSLGAIKEALSRLSRLRTAIRQSSNRGIAARIERYAEGVNLVPFKDLYYYSIQVLYPNTHQGLKDYLSVSITHTYAKLLYIKSRQSKLQTQRTESTSSLSIVDKEPKEARGNRAHNTIKITMGSIQRSSMPIQRPYPSSQSDLTSVNAE